MYQSVLADVRLFELLGRIDQDLARVVQGKGCGRCGGRLDRADYARKPRGMPVELGAEHAVRRSFCCAAEGCRRRTTPPGRRRGHDECSCRFDLNHLDPGINFQDGAKVSDCVM